MSEGYGGQQRRVIVIMRGPKVMMHRVFEARDEPYLYKAMENLLRQYPRGEGYRVYEGVADDFHDFCKRYPYVFQDYMGDVIAAG